MRRWKVEMPQDEWNCGKEEIIEADNIEGFDGFVEFYEVTKVSSWTGSYTRKRTIAIRQNCNATEITEEEK